MKRVLGTVAAAAVAAAMLVVVAGPAPAGPIVAPRKPDVQIKKAEDGSYNGISVYLLGAISYGATQNASDIIAAGDSQDFNVKIVNNGTVTDRYRLVGGKGFTEFGFKAKYFKGSTNITKDVVAGKYKTPDLAPAESFAIKATLQGSDTEGAFFVPVTVASTSNGEAIDMVRFGAANI